VAAAFRQFPTGRRDVDMATRLAVLTDAWNYFPLKARAGKCLAELLTELKTNEFRGGHHFANPCSVTSDAARAKLDGHARIIAVLRIYGGFAQGGLHAHFE
jgi:hypothetical protein